MIYYSIHTRENVIYLLNIIYCTSFTGNFKEIKCLVLALFSMQSMMHVWWHLYVQRCLFKLKYFLSRNWSSYEIATIYLSSNYKKPHKEMKMEIILDLVSIFHSYVLIMRYRVEIIQAGSQSVYRQIDRQIDRQTDRQTVRQTDRQTDS